MTSRSASRPSSAPLALERVEQPGEVAAGLGEVRPLDLDLVQPDDRVDDEVADRQALADDLRWTWLSGGTSTRTSPWTCGRQPAGDRREAPAPRGTPPRRRRAGERWPSRRLDAVLRERAHGRHDLAAAADATPAADGVEVDAERARGIEDRRARLEPTAPARRREDDLGVGGRAGGQPRRRRPAWRAAAARSSAAGRGVGGAARAASAASAAADGSRAAAGVSPSARRLAELADPASRVLVVAHQHIGGHDRGLHLGSRAGS